MFELLILLYAAAVGFVAAGIVSSFRQMVNAEPPQFRMAGERWTVLLASLAYFAFTGPVLVFRTLLSGGLAGRRSLTWTLAGIAVIGLWSCCLGLIVLQVILALVSLNA
jgi:hypothetical protein